MQFARENENLLTLRHAIDSAQNGIVITDPNLEDNPIIYANPAFLKMSGYTHSEVLGKNCRFLQRSDENRESLSLIRAAIKGKHACTTILKNYRKDGSHFWNELTISPVIDEDGNLVNFIGVQNDISPRMEAENRVSEFHSSISHELRTPLSSIRASISLVAEGAAGVVSPEVKGLVRIALANTDKLERLIQDILDLKSLQRGDLSLVRKSVAPVSVVESAILSLAGTASEAGVEIKMDIQSLKPIQGDPDRIFQVLVNLLSNAIKFSPAGTKVLIKVDDAKRVDLENEPDEVVFSVQDQGPGIPGEQVHKLFQRFQQLDGSDRRMKGGSGLGLAICRSIVELHGGRIGLDLTSKPGSRFWFSLPVSLPTMVGGEHLDNISD